jgi:hypothetical protein
MQLSPSLYRPLQVTLFALALPSPLGCSPAELGEKKQPESLEVVRASGSNQTSIELADVEAEAFAVADGSKVDSLDAPDALGAEPNAVASGGCTLLRPAGWTRRGVSCAEYYSPVGAPPDTLPMSNGESFIASAGYTFPSGGYGEARISCTNGHISIQPLSCFAGGSEP